jgi:glycosyltransferase involved in cell wall biosynthesis
MCTYNGARYLQEQLDSFASQRRLPEELVLCDDGSTDQTIALTEEFARRAPFAVRIFRNPQNLGYSRNFAKAVELCSGDVIALSDQDDRWYPQKLARLAELFEAHTDMDGVFSDGDLMDIHSKVLEGSLWGSFDFSPADQERLRSGHALEVVMRRNVVTGMAFAFRRPWRERLRGMPASWPHDAWLAWMLAQENKLLPCPEHLVAYRIHGNQQIGVPITSREKLNYLRSYGIGGYLALSRNRNLQEYEKNAKQFEDLLAAYGENISERDQEMIAQAQAKVAHSRYSAKLLSLSRWRRFAKVLRQRENYKRYSPTGVQAMIRDLFL